MITDSLEPADERLSGPFAGVFLATYAVHWDGAYIGYSKLCSKLPTSVWDVEGLVKVASVSRESPLEAMQDAEARAKKVIARFDDVFDDPPQFVPPSSLNEMARKTASGR